MLLICLFLFNNYLIENELKKYKFESAFLPTEKNENYKNTTWKRSILGSDCRDNYLYHDMFIFNSDSVLTYSVDALKVDGFYYFRKILWEPRHHEIQYYYQESKECTELTLFPPQDSLQLDGIINEYKISINEDSLIFYY